MRVVSLSTHNIFGLRGEAASMPIDIDGAGIIPGITVAQNYMAYHEIG
jgi:hypothetical protein